jgi:hypothetical protein
MSSPDNRRAAEDAELATASIQLEEVPQGAFALAGATVALLLLAWLLVYFLVFLQRGPVG